MKTKLVMTLLFLLALLLPGSSHGAAQGEMSASALGTAITYQGRLADGGTGVNGAYDFRFSLYDADAGGSQVGSLVTRDDVPVGNGYFTVQLDFGAGAFGNAARWLEVAVRPGTSIDSYTVLRPRQALTPAPYALFASSSPWSGLTGIPAGFADGVDNDTTYTAGTGLALSSGQFSLNSAYRLPQSCTNNQVPKWNGSAWICAADNNTTSFWSLTGNAGTNPSTNYLGTSDNTAFELRVNATRVMRLENATGSDGNAPNLIGGYSANWITSGVYGATLFGGGYDNYGGSFPNRVTNIYGTVSGGFNNQAGDNAGLVADASFATVSGGANNTASGLFSTIGGGQGNTASGENTTVCGGLGNEATDDRATIGGGSGNTAGSIAAIGGGVANTAASGATVAGGYWNAANGDDSTIAGGSGNTASGRGATIGGGGEYLSSGNIAIGNYSLIGGGGSNTTSGFYSTIVGGESNFTGGHYASVGGGEWNQAVANYATISGGGPLDTNDKSGTNNRVYDNYGTIGGGANNRAGSDDSSAITALFATVGGGRVNQATTTNATVGGGWNNSATATSATIGGGESNISSGYISTVGGGIGNQATTQSTTVAGGWYNAASGNASTVPGGASNEASGAYSFAAGADGHATHDGAFVWSSSTRTDSWGIQTYTVRAPGGVRFYSASGTGTGVQLSAGGGSWGSLSDRNTKFNFNPVDAQQVLEKVAALPVNTWSYLSQDASILHMGPMAQDFLAAFGLGEDEHYIGTLDADGVALAAIQGLYQLNQEQVAEIQSLKAQLYRLESSSFPHTAGSTPLIWIAVILLGISQVSMFLVLLRRKGGRP